MNQFLKKYIYPWFVDAASFASIIGLVIAFCSEDYAVIIALITLCISLTILLIAGLVAINKIIIRNYPNEYKKISSFYNFQCDDGIHSTFETFRLIQCKRSLLTELKYNFTWSGSITPKVSSENQHIEILSDKDESGTTTSLIKFKKPLTYNETTVLHIKTENDDADNTALPYLSCKIDTPIDVIQFRILLAYKPDDYSKPAMISRKRINSDDEFQIIGSATFNQKYKQYFYISARPDAGYIYKIEWEK